MFFLYDLHFEWHFCLVNDLIHVRSQALICESCRSRRNASFRLWSDFILPWSWIFVLISFESFDGISGPVNDMHALMMDQLRTALDIVAAWPIFFLDNRTINHNRVIHFSILRVGENDPYEIFVNADWVYFPLFVGHLQHPHFLLAAVHRLLETILLVVGFVLPRLILFSECNLHADWFLLSLRCLSFESFDLGVKAAGHSEFFLGV